MTHMQIGWLVAAVCAVISTRSAREFFLEVPRFFSCLALLALAWVMLLPFYGEIITSPLLPGFGSFLLVHSGGLVRSEARFRDKGPGSIRVDLLSQLALILLIPLAIPSVPFGMSRLNTEDVQLIAGTLLGAIGYLALLFGVKALRHEIPGIYRALFVITVVYTILEVSFLVGQFGSVRARAGLAMSAPMAYAFAAAKLLLTLVFSYSLIRYNEPRLSTRIIILRFFGLQPTPEATVV